ncbi:hypothetical protein Tco_0909716 [Tanacetum coccineum]|uniref:Uncharacterized protein n=1 Tax=Tanacetum coccineum TaxID=301880 RepID=A0ABQ5CQT5_9ASTR
MAGEGPTNMIARRVTVDLIYFSGENAPPRFMKFFLVQKIAESCKFVNRMRDEATTARDCDAKRGEQAKLVALNDVIAEALGEIDTLENNVEILDGLFTIVDWCSHLVDRMLYYACSAEGCSTARLQLCLLSMGPSFILEKLGEVAGSPRLPDKMKVSFDQARKEKASFAALMYELYCSLRVSLSKKCRLATELEGLGEQRDAVRALENMKEIVARDSMTLGDLEQLLARAQVGVDLKDGYLADVEEKV